MGTRHSNAFVTCSMQWRRPRLSSRSPGISNIQIALFDAKPRLCWERLALRSLWDVLRGDLRAPRGSFGGGSTASSRFLARRVSCDRLGPFIGTPIAESDWGIDVTCLVQLLPHLGILGIESWNLYENIVVERDRYVGPAGWLCCTPRAIRYENSSPGCDIGREILRRPLLPGGSTEVWVC
jgi:hypothetical protein